MRIIIFFAFLIFGTGNLYAQSSEFIQDYIARYRDIAIDEMKRSGVPASIKLAQGIHESMAGQSDLVQRSNNHFGIKCKSNWTGESVKHTDDAPNECFRKYELPEQSYKDHSDFLRNNKRYAFLFDLDPSDYEAWAHGLKKAGYATNPRYPDLIIKLVKEYDLQQYSLIAMGKMKDNRSEVLVFNNPKKEPAATPAVYSEPANVSKPQVANHYPSGVFKINDTKVIFALRGTSYLSIAQQYNLPLAKVFEYNDEQSPLTEVPYDQLVYLQRKKKTGKDDYHIVLAGETMADIAQQKAIRLENLLELNQLTHNIQPAPGEKIYLKRKAPAAPKTASVQAVNHSENVKGYSKTIIHRVKPKEGLYAIGRQYGVSVTDLQEWNKLSSDFLQVGQQIKIYHQ